MKKAGIVICLVGLIIAYNIYISYYSVDVTSYEIASDKIKNDVKIVMIGDVHDFHCKVKDKVIDKIRETEPDLILCVGDIIDDHSSSDEDTLAFLSQLTGITEVYMSPGNHEMSFYQGHRGDLRKIEEIGVHLLDQAYEDIQVNDNMLRIGGIYDYAFDLNTGKITQEAMHNNSAYRFLNEATSTDAFLLMMAHRPDSFIFGQGCQWPIDLVLSAHLHGGQVILPLVGGIYAPDQGWFPKVDYGQYEMGNMTMIVTRGISSSDEKFPRFNNPCEIVQITLTSR